MQAALGTGYELHREGTAVYTVPQGTEIEVFRKVLEAHCHFVFQERTPYHIVFHPGLDLPAYMSI